MKKDPILYCLLVVQVLVSPVFAQTNKLSEITISEVHTEINPDLKLAWEIRPTGLEMNLDKAFEKRKTEASGLATQATDFFKSGKYRKSLETATKALEMFQLLGDNKMITEMKLRIGIIYKVLADYEYSSKYYLQAFSPVYENSRQESTYKYYKLYIELSDRMTNQIKRTQMA